MIRCGLGGYVLRVASGARQPVTRNHLISSSLIERHPVCPWPDMARKTAFALMGACSLSIGFAQGRTQGNTPPTGVASLRTIEHNAFKAGEKLEYVLHYGLMNAGVATLELKEGGLDILGRKTLHARGEGHSAGAFKAFYKVNYPIQPIVHDTGKGGSHAFRDRVTVRHPSYIMPRDFDLSANFEIVKHHLKGFESFDYRQLSLF